MTDEELFKIALSALTEHWATRSIPDAVAAPDYDRTFGRQICRLMFEKSDRDVDRYRRALDDFIALSEEFVRLQFELDRTGKYPFSTFEEARREVYDNPEVMDGRYLNGLFLSEAFWSNHSKIHAYFVAQFCSANSPSGTVLEVPCGTGIFITEFARRNPGWDASAIDLSASAVRFSGEIARLNGGLPLTISRQDIFELPRTQTYDRLICGELLEHLEAPKLLLEKLALLTDERGKIFLTTAVWAANIDHIYLFKSAQEVREMLQPFFEIESELVLNVKDGFGPEDPQTPINYACVLVKKR